MMHDMHDLEHEDLDLVDEEEDEDDDLEAFDAALEIASRIFRRRVQETPLEKGEEKRPPERVRAGAKRPTFAAKAPLKEEEEE